MIKVELVVGSLAAVMPEALRFAFDALKDGTALQDAEFVIQGELAGARCESCGRDLLLESYLDSCPCGRSVLTWQSGSELSVRRMEVR